MSAPVLADEAPARHLEEMVVYGRADQQIGRARSASEGFVGYDDIRLPPMLRVGELVEAVPGMVATQHSGTGKANQYFLRGFNLDHGTDFAAFAEGVPLNMRSHGHGQGYLDLNFLIPELVRSAAYRKGPYAAEVGDFSSAGSVDLRFYDALPDQMLRMTAGSYGYRRGLVAGSFETAPGDLTAAVDLTRYDGPWDLEENLEQDKLFLSQVFAGSRARGKVTLQIYDGRWDATDQIPRRAVDQGLIDETGFIDPDLGGRTKRSALTAGLDFGAWHVDAYAVDYELSLFSNFTYLLDDPLLGDEFEQRDERRVYGLRFGGERRLPSSTRPIELHWGMDLRHDEVGEVGLFRTVGRRRTGVVRQDSLDELSVGAYVEMDVELTERLRGIGGVRFDRFDWQVDSFRPENSGSGRDSVISPNLGLVFRPADDLELYASWGRGFHSNDVRGTTIEVDPVTGESTEPVAPLVEARGAELGLRFERGRRFNASLVGFWLELDSELVYVGDVGTTEPLGATLRRGAEAAAFWRVNPWLGLNAAYTVTAARFEDDHGGGDEIPGAIGSTFTLGVNAQWRTGISASARLRYLGGAPLVEDRSVESGDSMLINAGVAWRRSAMELRLDVFNLLDSGADDIAYFYPSRLPGEPAAGVEDVHFHPLEPRSVRGTVTVHW